MRHAIVLLLILPCVRAEEIPDLRIGLRTDAKNANQIRPENLQALVKRFLKVGVIALDGKNNAEAEALINEARDFPEIMIRVLIRPGFPNAVPGADNDVRARVAAVLGLSQDRRTMLPLLESSVIDPDDGVRRTAAKALALLEEPVALRKLADLAISRDRQRAPWPVRKLACQALRRYGDKEAVERVLREVSFELAAGNPFDPKNPLRGKGAGIGSENPLALPTSTPDLHLSEQDLYPALSALKELTGNGFDKGEKDVKTWQKWWDAEREKFSFKD